MAAAVSVPAGSHLTVNVTGGSGEPTLALDGHARAVPARWTTTSFQADRELTEGGLLTVQRDGRDLAAWDVDRGRRSAADGGVERTTRGGARRASRRGCPGRSLTTTA